VRGPERHRIDGRAACETLGVPARIAHESGNGQA
jgi:hypothetical protein